MIRKKFCPEKKYIQRHIVENCITQSTLLQLSGCECGLCVCYPHPLPAPPIILRSLGRTVTYSVRCFQLGTPRGTKYALLVSLHYRFVIKHTNFNLLVLCLYMAQN